MKNKYKAKILAWAIYLCGCAICYPMSKNLYTKKWGRWTKKDQAICLLISSSSWVGVGVNGVYIILKSDFWNEPANF